LDQQRKIELAQKIQDAFIVGKLKGTPAWGMVIEACKQAEENASHKLRYVNPNDKAEIARLQERSRIYGSFLPNLIAFLEHSGEEAITEANDEGVSLEDLF